MDKEAVRTGRGGGKIGTRISDRACPLHKLLTAFGEEGDDGVYLTAAVDVRELGGAVEGEVVDP